MNPSVLWSGRLALFLIYGWFGLLKALGYSPAEPLVLDLLQQLAPWMSPEIFLFVFALFELLIGTAFLVAGPRTWVVRLFLVHMTLTFLPLVVLPGVTWQTLLVPTLIGQYILKNLALLSLVKFMQASEVSI